MQLFIEGSDGFESVNINFSELSEDELRLFAKMDIAEAREELKNRIGFDPYKKLEDYTPEDIKFFDNWRKNQRSSERDKIVEESSDEGSGN